MDNLPGVTTKIPFVVPKLTAHEHEWKRYNKDTHGVVLQSWYCACGKTDVYDMEVINPALFANATELNGKSRK